MGCVPQNGCLGPKRREKEVYAQLIESIYNECQRLQGSQSVSKKNVYNSIRDKINKKGLVRKLVDHLSSHKNKLNDCLTYNLRLVSQSKTLEGKLAGLLIINQITTHLYIITKSDNTQDDKTIAKTTSSQKKLVQDSQMKVGIDLRFDIAYFRLILQLMQNQKELISNVLNSIIMCCSGRKQKLGCKAQVWRVLQHLLRNLHKGILKQNTAKCYLILLQLLKQGGKEQSSHESDLLAFFRLWQKEEDYQPDSASDESYQITIFKIVRLFVNRCMSSWDSKVLFRSLFQLYEDQRFPVDRLIKLQGSVIGIIQQHDFHAHILRGLFLYLLEFLSATPTAQKNQYRASFTQEFEFQRFPHVYDRSIKLRLFQTLRRWGERGYINLDQSVSFSSSSLVGAYINNFQGQREYVQQVVQQFFRMTKFLKERSNLTIVTLFLDEIRWQKTDENIRKLLINLTRQLLQTCKLLQKPQGDFYNLLVLIDSHFSKETKIQIIQLMGFMIKHISLDNLFNENDEQQVTLQTLCQFFYSLYEGSKSHISNNKIKNREQQQILWRYQYANAVLSFMKCFLDKNAHLYILGFLQSIKERLGAEQQDKIVQYFQLYILYEGMHLVNQRHKLPDRMISINFKISPSLKYNEIKQDIENFVAQLAGTKGELYSELRNNIRNDLQTLRQFTMIKEADYKLMQQSFKYYFKPAKSQQQMNSSKIEASRSQFKRESVNGSFYESCRDNSLNGEQNSFKDVLERIV